MSINNSRRTEDIKLACAYGTWTAIVILCVLYAIGVRLDIPSNIAVGMFYGIITGFGGYCVFRQRDN